MQYLFKRDLKNHFLAAASTKIALIFSGIALLALASQLSIPLKPVPLTFQSTTVILIGMLYGARNGTTILLSYLCLGCVGFPVFSGASFGLATLLGPTGGYLLGFIPAVFVSGYFHENGFAQHWLNSFLIACLSTAIIFFFGVLRLVPLIGWMHALQVGVLPFLISEPIKLLCLSCVLPKRQ